MTELLAGRLLLLFSQNSDCFCNKVRVKSQANNRAGHRFSLAVRMTKCIASQAV
jgi:hypothetical protein